jgi:hypothetical protein
MLVLHAKASELSAVLESLGYFDLAHLIRSGQDATGSPVSQNAYDGYVREADAILTEEHGNLR